MSRQLRARLEVAQGQRRALQQQLETPLAPPTLSPEDRASLEALQEQIATLEAEVGALQAQRDHVLRERDEVQAEALRNEPQPPTSSGLAVVLMTSLLIGWRATALWSSLPWSTRWPLVSFGVVLLATASFLLREAWWLGRTSAARRDGQLS